MKQIKYKRNSITCVKCRKKGFWIIFYHLEKDDIKISQVYCGKCMDLQIKDLKKHNVKNYHFKKLSEHLLTFDNTFSNTTQKRILKDTNISIKSILGGENHER